MKRSFLALPLLLLSWFVFAQPSSARTAARARAFPVTIIDDHGYRVHLTSSPIRILSLDPRDTETLFALDLSKRVVGDGSKYDEGAAGIVNRSGKPRYFRFPSEWPSPWGRNYPVRALLLPHVEGGCCGTPFNLETIESLHPDLVVGPYSKTELPTFQKLRSLGLKVIINDPANLRGTLHDIVLLGKATGTEKQAATVVRLMKVRVAALKRRLAPVRSSPRVYYEIDATNPLEPYTAGPGTYIDEGIHLVRARNVADSVTSCSGSLCYPQLSLEALVALNPQVIVLGDAAYGASAAGVRKRSGWETMSAVQSGRIYPFDDSLISRAGPRFVIGLEALARLVHPGVFHRG